jgi:transposase
VIQAPKPEPRTIAIKPFLPNKPGGVPRVNDRRVLNGIFWVLRSGAPWRDLPDNFGPYTTCYKRFVRWRRAGVGHQLLNALTAGHAAVVQMIDTSIVRMHQHGACTAGNSEQLMGRSRGGLTTKIHAFVDASGLPVRLALTTGEAHDNRHVLALLSGLRSGAMLLADRRFDADWMRALVSQYGAWANIPPRRNRTEPALVATYLAPGIWSSGSSTRSSNVAGSRPVMTSLRQLLSLHPACLNQTRACPQLRRMIALTN